MQPGGGIPLVNDKLVLGVVTCSCNLCLIIVYYEEAVDTLTMEKIIDKATEFLLHT